MVHFLSTWTYEKENRDFYRENPCSQVEGRRSTKGLSLFHYWLCLYLCPWAITNNLVQYCSNSPGYFTFGLESFMLFNCLKFQNFVVRHEKFSISPNSGWYYLVEYRREIFGHFMNSFTSLVHSYNELMSYNRIIFLAWIRVTLKLSALS